MSILWFQYRAAQQDFQARLSQCEAEKAELVRSIEDLRMEVDNRRRAASNMAAMCEMDKESLRKEILRLERDNDLAKRASVEFDASYNKRLKNIEKVSCIVLH
jgi:inhibitor of KinA sporulation pathway (predicted exonuclease)